MGPDRWFVYDPDVSATANSPTPTPTPTPTGNSTTPAPTGTATTLTGTYVAVSQTLTMASLDLTATPWSGDLKKLAECAYLDAINSNYCVVSSGAIAWLSTIGITSTATDTRRTADVAFTAQFATSMSLTEAGLIATTSSNLISFATNFDNAFSAAVSLSGLSNFSAALGAATAQAASVTTSSASVLVPSMLTGLAAAAASLYM